MLQKLPQLLLFVLCFIGVKEMNAQKMYDVTVELPATMSSQNLIIHIDDGIEFHQMVDSFIQKKLAFKGAMYSDTVTLNLQYNMNDSISYNYNYFIDNSPALFVFKETSINDLGDPFQNCDITNALNIDEIPLELKRRDFIKKEGKEVNIFLEKNRPSRDPNDSFQIKFQQKMQKVVDKQLEFITKYPDEYYSFYLFRTQIVYPALGKLEYDSIEAQRLFTFLHAVFPKKFTESPEGEALQEKLRPRQPITVNALAPDFEATDILGNKVVLDSFRGKYVLLDFWGTWCPPCMEQIPFIKNLRDTYSSDNLVIISISTDTNRKQFEKVIKEKEMNWVHIYDKTFLPDKYSVRAYPTLILINDNGVIVYDGKKYGLAKLTELLEEM